MTTPCEWLRKAENDLKASMILLQEELLDGSAFHAQQAAEKALKAILVALGVKPPRTHRIERLLSLVEDKIDVSWAYEEDIPALSYYAIEIRYPGPPVTEEEAREALNLAGKVVEWVKKRLEGLGMKC